MPRGRRKIMSNTLDKSGLGIRILMPRGGSPRESSLPCEKKTCLQNRDRLKRMPGGLEKSTMGIRILMPRDRMSKVSDAVESNVLGRKC